MSAGQLETVIQHIRKLAASQAGEGLTDSELLERFSLQRDQTAFSALLVRHGGLVWNVCRHVLDNDHDAEDAFQATFLVLARKAPSVQNVGSWLHKVAFLSSMELKRKAARRRTHEKQAMTMPQPKSQSDLAWRELLAIIDEEVQGLPEKLREPFVLCCLEAKSKAEAARQLGWPEGTVSGRLAQARKRLQQRLTRRGITLSAGLAVTALAPNASLAKIPTALVEGTIRHICLFAAGNTTEIATSQVAVLAEAVMKSMMATKVKLVLAVTLMGTLLATGIGFAAYHKSVSTTGESALRNPPTLMARADGPDPAEGKTAGTDCFGDPLPSGAIGRLGTTRLQQDGRVNTLAFSPDGIWLASAGADPVIRLWDAETGKECLSLKGHQGPVHRVSFVPAGKGKPAQVLVSAGYDDTIRFWDLNSGEQTRVINFPGEPRALAVSPDGKLLASAGRSTSRHLRRRVSPDGKLLPPLENIDSYIILWTIQDGREVRRWKAHEGGVLSLAFDPDGKSIASAGAAQRESPPAKAGDPSDDYGVALWETDTGKLQHTFAHDARIAWTVEFSADGKFLASTAVNKMGGRSLVMWDPKTGQQLRSVAGPLNVVDRILALTKDGKTLAAADLSRIAFYDSVARGEQGSVLERFPDHVQTLAFSPDCLTLASGGEKGHITLWDVRRRRSRLEGHGHTQPMNSVAIAPDGKNIVTTAYGESAWLWDRATNKPRRQFNQEKLPGVALVWCADFSPDGRTLALAHQREGITFWDLKTGQLQRQIPPENLHRTISIAFSPDGKLLVSESSDQPYASLWDTTTGKLLHSYPHPMNMNGFEQCGSSATISPDSRLLASVGRGGTLHLWHLDNNKPGIVKMDANATSAAFSPGGLLVATAGIGVKIFDAVTSAELAKFESQYNSDARKGIAFSPDGRLLAVADTKHLRLWEIAARRELRPFEGHRGAVNSLAFTPDGKALVSGSEDGTALIWKVENLIPPIKDSEPKPT
jgi:RNA polymerase sigma factor (sigma-70 family)